MGSEGTPCSGSILEALAVWKRIPSFIQCLKMQHCQLVGRRKNLFTRPMLSASQSSRHRTGYTSCAVVPKYQQPTGYWAFGNHAQWILTDGPNNTAFSHGISAVMSQVNCSAHLSKQVPGAVTIFNPWFNYSYAASRSASVPKCNQTYIVITHRPILFYQVHFFWINGQ